MPTPLPPGTGIATTDDGQPSPVPAQAREYLGPTPSGGAVPSLFLSVLPVGGAVSSLFVSLLPPGLAIAMEFVTIEATYFASEIGDRFISEGGDYFIG